MVRVWLEQSDISTNDIPNDHRVLGYPAPACHLIEFADSGIALELRVWFTDLQQGIGSIRAEVNVAVWRAFKKAGITIPFPQRDVHLRQVDTSPAAASQSQRVP